MLSINCYYIHLHRYSVICCQKIMKHVRNLQAENDPQFRKRAGWPKNLVSYKKKCVEMSSHV